MPTLLSVNNYYYRRGGAEILFLEHNELLKETGWNIIPFAMKHEQNQFTEWGDYFVEEIEYGKDYSFLRKAGMASKVIYSLEARRKIVELLARVKPDVCHLHNIYHHISPSILSSIHKRGIPTVLTLHDLKLACPAYQMLAKDGVCEKCKNGRTYNVLLKKCIKESRSLSLVVYLETVLHNWLKTYERNVDRFVVPSKFYMDKMIEWGWDKKRFVYIPNYVNTDSLNPDYSAGKDFVYFGRLSGEKGIHTLIKAARIANVRLRIIGEGPEKGALFSLAEKIGANVDFLGFLKGEPLHDAIRASRAVVLPSEWYENAPLSILESYALGKPVIGAAIGGIPELIKQGQTGATFTSGSAEDLAEKMNDFVGASDNDIKNMGENGRSWIEEMFTPEVYRRNITELYRELGVT